MLTLSRGLMAVVAAPLVLAGCAVAGAHGAASTAVEPGIPLEDAPSGFTAEEFRVAPPADMYIGGPILPRPTCAPGQIVARAGTRPTPGGVLGVVHLRGRLVKHEHGWPLRCSLPVRGGPSAVVDIRGRRLPVGHSPGAAVNPPANGMGAGAVVAGDAAWGFAWLGSYCGAPPAAVVMPLDHGRDRWLRVPLRGPAPDCHPGTGTSVLVDGIAGSPGQPVQAPRPEATSLTLTGHIRPGTTSSRLAPLDLTFSATGGTTVTLDPCPHLGGRVEARATSGGFSDPLQPGLLGCAHHIMTIEPGHPLRWTIRNIDLTQGAGTGAIPGTTVSVTIGIAGVPQLRLTTTAH